MEENVPSGWKKLITGYPWFRRNGRYKITAYSEFMPPPLPDYKPYGKPDHLILSENDPFGWKITKWKRNMNLSRGLSISGSR